MNSSLLSEFSVKTFKRLTTVDFYFLSEFYQAIAWFNSLTMLLSFFFCQTLFSHSNLVFFLQSNVHMNLLVQPAGEWCVDLLHADCGDCVVCSFNYWTVQSFVYLKKFVAWY